MKMKKLCSAMRALLLVGTGLQAATALALEKPDAGQSLQQQQPALPQALPGKAYNPLEPDAAEAVQAAKPTADEVKVLVTAVRVQGSTVFKAADLESLYSAMLGTEQSFDQLKKATRLITRLYRKHGYSVARAFLPAQDITNGEITIQVLEGKLDKVVLKNRSDVPDAKVEALISRQVQPGTLMDASKVNKALLLLNELPGVGRVQGALQPGAAIGTTQLMVQVPEGRSRVLDVSLDNTGNRFTGQYRLSGHALFNNPLKMGDRLDLRASLSDEALAYARVNWDAFVGTGGLRLGGSLSYNRYELGGNFAALDAHGTSQTLGLNASIPLRLDMHGQIHGELSLEDRQLSDEVGLTSTVIDKSVQDAVLRVLGSHAGAGWSGAWRVEGSFGSLDIDPAKELANDQKFARTNGSFNKWGVSGSVLKTLTTRSGLYATVSAQFADKNLDSSEKMVLGGVNGVRAYPAGEGLGDDGWLGSLEWRYMLLPTLQAVTFVDGGSVDINHDPFAPGANSRNLSGYGVALNAEPVKGLSLKMTAAWRGSEVPVSDKDQSPRLWVQAGYVF